MNYSTGQGSPEPVHLAWTAGWDSTFRLMQLLLSEKRPVQPHYIVRPEASTGREIDAMNQIRRALFRQFPESRELLRPTSLVDVRALTYSVELTKECERVRKLQKLNEQYPLLACYCDEFDIQKMEVCINGDETVALSAIKASPQFNALLSPLTELRKQATKDFAYSKGWQSIMNLTVFCRRPRNGRPCGVCGPCFDAITMGLGYRLPLSRRLIAHGQVPLRRWWRANKSSMSPKLKSLIIRIMKGRY